MGIFKKILSLTVLKKVNVKFLSKASGELYWYLYSVKLFCDNFLLCKNCVSLFLRFALHSAVRIGIRRKGAETRVVFCISHPLIFQSLVKKAACVRALAEVRPRRKKTWRIGRSLKFLAKMRPPAKRGSRSPRERESAAAHTIKHKIREKKTRRLAFSADVHALRILCPGIKRTGTGRRRKRKMYKHNKSRRAGRPSSS